MGLKGTVVGVKIIPGEERLALMVEFPGIIPRQRTCVLDHRLFALLPPGVVLAHLLLLSVSSQYFDRLLTTRTRNIVTQIPQGT
eukprot:4493552-Pyramimonas_sp.AAC.1